MKTLQIVAPVIIMIILGFFGKRIGILNNEGTSVIKKYITQMALPVLIFNAVATSTYNKSVIFIFIVMFIDLCTGFGLGYLFKRFIKPPYNKHFPFLMTIYECGLFGYPLFTSIYGSEHLSSLVLVDLAGCFFAFSIFFTVLDVEETGKKISIKEIGKTAIKSPCFIAVCLGLVLGLSGLMAKFLSTEGGDLYTNVKDFITTPINSMILLCIGSEFDLDKSRLKVCIKTVGFRIVIQAVLLTVVYSILSKVGVDEWILKSIVLYFILTPSFGLSSFSKDKEGSAYMATTVSLYTIVTVVAYIGIVIFT